MSKRLENQVVLITGTAGGQGRAAAILFAREGAKVYGCDLPDKSENSQETAQLAGEGGDFETANVDVTDPAAARSWVDACAADAGQIDVLYNNAALEKFAPFAEMSADDFRFALRHEIEVVFHPTQAAWKHLARQGGSIICTASASGMRGSERIGSIAHAAGKGAVIAMVRQLALEGAPHWIRVNSISPGPIDTPVTQMGLDADKWFGNVEKTMLQLQNPKVAKKARHGYCRGEEPVKYVSEIQSRYDNYLTIVKDLGPNAAPTKP